VPIGDRKSAIGNAGVAVRATRVLYLGDSPLATTGFGVVAAQLCAGFVEAGLDVTCLGASDTRETPLPYRLVPVAADDPYGVGLVPALARETDPHVVFMCHELRLTSTWVRAVREVIPHIPIVAYRGIPGDPLPDPWVQAVREVDITVAYTEYARRVMERDAGIQAEVLPHGVDHAVFRRLPAGERERIRGLAGWHDRFVVLYVGRNRPNKAHPDLIEAIALLVERGMGDVLCHLQCNPVEHEVISHPEGGFILGGWNLKRIVRERGVEHAVVFPAHYRQAVRGSPHAGRSDEPTTAAELGLIHLYAAADLYVHPSPVETFGLPLLEAMACGLPVIHRDDGGNMNELCAHAGLRLMATRHLDDGYGGRALVGLEPDVIADGIADARERLASEDEKRAWVSRCLARAAEFPWEPTKKRMCEIVQEAACRTPRQ
jgi:glycosyltransferase involved in cell wall biosynthesis